MIERNRPIQGTSQVEQVQPVGRREAGDQFGVMLRRELRQAAPEGFSVAFSKHAMARAEERGIEVTDTLMGQLAARVGHHMVQEEMQENIFTNIDGAVLLK